MTDKQIKRARHALARGVPLSEAQLSELTPAAINAYHALAPGEIRRLGIRDRLPITNGVFSANLIKFAAALGEDAAVTALRRVGGNPLLADDFGRGPFHVARNGEVVRALVAPGRSGCGALISDIHAAALDGGTPLLSAAAITSKDESFQATAVAALLDFGADPLMPNKGGSIPLHFCATADAAMRLIQAGGADATVNVRNKYGDCPLHLAVSHGFVEVVHVLLRYGADTSVPSRIGRTITGGRGIGLMLPTEMATVIADLTNEPEAKQALGEVRLLLEACGDGKANRSHPRANGRICLPTPPLIPRSTKPLLFGRLAWLSMRTLSKYPRDKVERATGIPRSIIDEIIVIYIGPFRCGESVHIEGGTSTCGQRQQMVSSRGGSGAHGRSTRAHAGCRNANSSCSIQ